MPSPNQRGVWYCRRTRSAGTYRRPPRAAPPDRRSRVHSSADHPPAPPKNNTSTDRDAAAYRLPYTDHVSLDSRTSAADGIRPDSHLPQSKGNLQRALCPLRINRKLNRLPCRYRAIRLLACSAAGVKHTIRNAIHASSSKHISSCQIIPYHYISNIGIIFSIAQNRRTVNKSCRTKRKEKTGSIQTF